jgi:hypothetical protein
VRAWSFFAWAALSCSADAVKVEDPTLETPGSFVATRRGDGRIQLDRLIALELLPATPTLAADALLHLTSYDETAASFDEARELAKRHDLTPAVENGIQLESALRAREFRVVWFRTLTDDERP